MIATENPIEQEGTFPLPEAQLDRFALRAALGYPDEDEEVVDRRSRSGTAIRSTRSSRSVTPTTCATLQRGGRGRLRRRADLALDRRARARDARGRGRRARRVGARQPHARAHGARVGAAARPRPRRARGHRAALPAGARPPAAAHGVVPRRDARRSAATRRSRRSATAASSSRRRPRRTGTADAGAPSARERRTFPLVPRRRLDRPAVRRPAEPPPRARQRRDRHAAVRAGRSGLDDRLVRDARASRRRRARDEFVVREHAADEAPRVVLVADRRPAMGLYPVAAPVAREAARRSPRRSQSIVASAAAARADVAALDFADGEPCWLPPRAPRPAVAGRRARPAPRRSTRRRTRSQRAFAFLGRRRARPAGRHASSSSSRTSSRRRPPRRGSTRVGHGWDVVPVVIQDPVWEQSFPRRRGRRGPGRRPARRRVDALVRLSGREARAAARATTRSGYARAARRARVARPRAGRRSASSDPSTIDSAFLAWAEERRRRRWAR